MKQDFIATCVANYLSSNNVKFCEEETTSDAYGNYEWGQHFFDVFGANASFDGIKDIAEAYNKEVGKDVLHVAIICRKHGQSEWAVDDDYVSSAVDAAEKPWVYGGGDCSNTHVVAYEDIEAEEEFILSRADDMAEADAKTYKTKINDKFCKIREMMIQNDVLVYNGPDLDSWEIRDRYPTSWTEDTIDYMVVLLISLDFNEDKIEDLEDLAYYLNGCWTEGGNDPCNFISEWCDHNSCIYTEDDDAYEFAGKDFAYSEWDEQLLTMADDGSFIVVDHKAELKDK